MDENGKFYLRSYKLDYPTIATLRREDISIDLYIAPGYNLTLTGDLEDKGLFHLNKKITGVGSQSNRYLFMADSIAFADKDTVQWTDLDEKALLNFVKKNEQLKDSLYHTVFDRQPHQDNWFKYFAKMTSLDNKFIKLYYLIFHAMINKSFSYAKAVSFVNENFDKNVLADLYKEEYLISSTYTGWLMGTYSSYLRELNCRKDSSYCDDKKLEAQLLEQIASHYKGKIRDIKLYRKLDLAITNCRSFDELNMYRKDFPPYISLLKSEADQKKMQALLAGMETTLLQTQIGNPAPAFTAEDSAGLKYSIGDYKGKVIYLDLWASWCAPCRAEAPHLKNMVAKYKNDSSIVFISIAVSDKITNWKDALLKDKPTCLQLFDTNGNVQSAYVANSIPKFIVIDKQGNIVSFDAPAPSNVKELEVILDREIAK